MRSLVDEAKAELEEARRQEDNADTWNKAKWGFMAFPLLGAAVLVADHFTDPKGDIRNRAEELQRNYDDMVRKESEGKAQLVAAKSTLDLLRDTTNDMGSQADDLSSALKQIYTAATKTINENKELACQIRSLDEDLDDLEQDLKASKMDSIRDLLTDSMEDVEKCLAMWHQVHQVGLEFERGGELAGSYSVLPDFAGMEMSTGWQHF